MKRMIIVSILIVAVVGAGIVESIFSTKIFSEFESELIVLEQGVDENKSNISVSDNIVKVDAIISKWNGVKDIVIMFSNHAVVRSFEEKLYALQSSVKTGEFVNAKEYLMLSRALARDLIDETYLHIGNLF